jgi:hypothetical protein
MNRPSLGLLAHPRNQLRMPRSVGKLQDVQLLGDGGVRRSRYGRRRGRSDISVSAAVGAGLGRAGFGMTTRRFSHPPRSLNLSLQFVSL